MAQLVEALRYTRKSELITLAAYYTWPNKCLCLWFLISPTVINSLNPKNLLENRQSWTMNITQTSGAWRIHNLATEMICISNIKRESHRCTVHFVKLCMCICWLIDEVIKREHWECNFIYLKRRLHPNQLCNGNRFSFFVLLRTKTWPFPSSRFFFIYINNLYHIFLLAWKSPYIHFHSYFPGVSMKKVEC